METLTIAGIEWNITYWGVTKNYRWSAPKTWIQLSYTDMYDLPEVTFAMLNEISEFFGTKEISWDGEVLSSGCETCGYGGKKELTIDVFNATLNLVE